MIRFYNGKTLEGLAVTDHEVWVEGDRIAYVGAKKDETPVFEREIDLKGNLLMPGFKNAHTHSGMTFLRSLADDLPLQDWLFQMVFPREAKLSAESLAAFVKVAFLEYIAGGVTACFDMYFYIEELARIATEWGFRAVICESMTAGEDYSVLHKRFEKYNNYSPFVRYQLGFHADYTGNMDMFRYIAEAAHQYKAPVFCHNSETEKEYRECIERYGMSPTQLFDSLGMYDYGGGGFHCVWFSDEDMDIFRRRGCWAVTNPCSNAKLASGIFPLTRMMEKGVNLALGTDGPASNNALDMFREMYLANVLAKLRDGNAAAGNPAHILSAATSGGALALGLTDCDRIAEGKQADMIVIDMSRANMRPVNNIVKNLVYAGSPADVRLTMIAGRILYENGEFFVGEEPEAIYREAERHTRLIVNAE